MYNKIICFAQKPVVNRKMTVLLVIGIMMFLCFQGCSKDDTTSPLENATVYEKLYAELFNTTEFDSVEIVVTDSVETNLDVEFGASDSVSMSIEGETNFIIAYDSTITDSIELGIDCSMLAFVRGNDSSKIAMAFSCSPEGQVFENSLIFDIHPGYFNNNPSSNVVKLYGYNPAGNWSVVCTQQKSSSRLRFEVDHFSKYAISD